VVAKRGGKEIGCAWTGLFCFSIHVALFWGTQLARLKGGWSLGNIMKQIADRPS
jgi:hypothetical protein